MKIFALLFCTVSLTGLAIAAPLTPQQTTDLLQRVQSVAQEHPSLEANFREERHVAMLKDPVISEGKIWFSVPNKIRREIGGKTPSTTIINATTMTIYYPNFNEAEQYDLNKRPMIKDSLQALTAGLDFQRMTSLYFVRAADQGTNYQIFLTPKAASVRRIVKSATISLSKSYLPQGINFVSSRGEQIIETYSNVRHNSIPDSTFEFTPPAGTKITHPLGS